MGKIIGIDLGTTNSVVAVMEGSEPKVIVNEEGNQTTPSVVAFTKEGEILVGQVAKRQAIANPENTIFSVKRFMGRSFGEVNEEMKMVPYKVVKGPKNDVRIEVQGKQYSPPEISAMILQKLKKSAEAYLGETVTEAVLLEVRRDPDAHLTGFRVTCIVSIPSRYCPIEIEVPT